MPASYTQVKPSAPAFVPSSLDKSLLMLESVCARLLETRFPIGDDSERMVWQQQLKNIVTPLSLALAEIKGPRQFHNHYRHDVNDDTILKPVLENPIDMLAHACEKALHDVSIKLNVVHDADLVSAQNQLEKILRKFLTDYTEQKTA